MRHLALILAGTMLGAAPLLAQAPAANPAPSAPAAANVTVGATVSDANGGAVGTIESVTGGNAIVSTGTVKANLPLTAFAKGPNGLVVGITKADLEAAVAKATQAVQIAAGARVVGPQGAAVGTVEAVNGDLVMVTMPSGKVQLPRNAFAAAPDGALMIGLTPAQLEAAAKAATPNQGS